MTSRTRVLLWLIGGLLLFLGPWFVRAIVLDYDQRSYAPPDIPAASMAATPRPTLTPAPLAPSVAQDEAAFRTGPVVVDLAHLNRLNRSSFQPLAAALAEQNVGLRFWLPKDDLDTFELQNFLDFPDQSDRLAIQLADASAFVVISPFFLWSTEEIALMEQFVANGGRLLLISDPDITGDVARDINNLAEPFGVVFNDDYLYDTRENDGNYTHIFLADFNDRAADLADNRIAFYGARSISGATAPQASSIATTLSSVRPGLSGFTTIALGGVDARNTAGHVLVMSDFDVLTTPYVDRHDNRRLVDFVAAFLADSSFTPTIVDFPAYFDKEVKLLYGRDAALGAALLTEGARLQDRLAATGRTLTLGDRDVLAAAVNSQPDRVDRSADDADGAGDSASHNVSDLIYLADFTTAEADAGLLTQLGLTLVKEIEVEAEVEAEETGEVADIAEGATVTPAASIAESVTGTSAVTATVVPTATVTVTSTPTVTPTPAITTYLETQAGLRFLADETLLIGLSELDSGVTLLALLAPNEAGISAGVERLLKRDFRDCIREPARLLCPLAGDADADASSSERSAPDTPGADSGRATPANGATPSAVPTPQATPAGTPGAPGDAENRILLIDDNDGAREGDASEADFYLKALAVLGESPELWSTEEKGTPALGDLLGYRWVIWSGGGYTVSGPGLQDLSLIFEYTNVGGRVTISSRQPGLGHGSNEPAPILDLIVDAEGEALAQDLPTDVIELAPDLPPVQPLSETFIDTTEVYVSLRRGPASEPDGAPVLMYYSDEDAPEPQGAQIAILGMALNWLPDDVQQTLVANMKAWMLPE